MPDHTRIAWAPRRSRHDPYRIPEALQCFFLRYGRAVVYPVGRSARVKPDNHVAALNLPDDDRAAGVLQRWGDEIRQRLGDEIRRRRLEHRRGFAELLGDLVAQAPAALTTYGAATTTRDQSRREIFPQPVRLAVTRVPCQISAPERARRTGDCGRREPGLAVPSRLDHVAPQTSGPTYGNLRRTSFAPRSSIASPPAVPSRW